MISIERANGFQQEVHEAVCAACGLQSGNHAVLFDGCAELLERVRSMEELPSREHRLTKSQKKRLWETRGKKCERCSVENVGGPNYAIHPFRPADWDGTLTTVQVLCAACLGKEASKRDKILEMVREQTM